MGCPTQCLAEYCLISILTKLGLTNRWSQLLAVAMRPFDFMQQFSVFATLAPASGGSAPSR